MRTKSTDLMNKIIEYINKVYIINKRSPSMREISNELSVSVSVISRYVVEMEAKGLIKNYGKSRGLATEQMQKTFCSTQSLPLIGSISCGLPLLAEENVETYIPIPTEFIGSGKHFILRAKGSSMINIGISDGDLVIVRQQDTADEGQVVVALIDDEATLKRYFVDRDNKKIRLHPENNRMKDIYVDNIIIQGVAVKVIKDVL